MTGFVIAIFILAALVSTTYEACVWRDKYWALRKAMESGHPSARGGKG